MWIKYINNKEDYVEKEIFKKVLIDRKDRKMSVEIFGEFDKFLMLSNKSVDIRWKIINEHVELCFMSKYFWLSHHYDL